MPPRGKLKNPKIKKSVQLQVIPHLRKGRIPCHGCAITWSWTLEVFQECKNCPHTMMEHVFLMADVGRCLVDGCDCRYFAEEKQNGKAPD